jgi:hypothetical protein
VTLKRRPNPDHRQFAAKWPVVDRQPFAVSDANTILTDELDRYLNDLVRGRSFLIAGHRGAGKTFLVRNTVECAHLQIFATAGLAIISGQKPKTLSNLQRPLLVQVHGPSLLAPPKDGDHETARELAAKGMAQVMIALFRAAAEEYCDAFTNHVPNLPAPRQPGMMELAAQLRLDLDMGAEPARLREYWRRFGRLGPGILWPAAIASARGPGQGAAEIVALATAAQAFQVCAGELKLKKSASDGAKREASVESSVEPKPSDGLKDISDKLFALGAGAAAGTAAYATQSTALAALAGLAAGLITAFGLKLAGRRSLASTRSTAYEFLPDMSLETLDRDLPQVIRRLRQAGLAPVFVIDELDKIAPGRERDDVMAKLIDRLKLLTTDHGFFCFLTDRNYYESVRRRASANGYAREHTHFSHRLLVSYQPRDFRRYAEELLQWPQDDPEKLEQAIFVSQLMHRSELNFIDFTRLLNASLPPPPPGADTIPPPPLPPPPSSPRLQDQWHAVIQLAIEHVWRDSALLTGMASDQSFSQLTADALYLISRRWKMDSDGTLNLNSGPIAHYLVTRLAGDEIVRDRPGEAEAHAETLQDFNVSKDRQDSLVNAVQTLARLLCDFSALQTALASLPEAEKTLLRIVQSMPAPALLKDLGDNKFRFLYDEFGTSIASRDGMKPGEPLTPFADQVATEVYVYIQAFVGTLSELEIGLEYLVRAGALPPNLPWAEVVRFKNNLVDALRQKQGYFDMAAECEILTSCQNAVQQRAEPLALSLQLGVAIAEQTRPPPNPAAPNPPPRLGCDISPLAHQLGANWNAMTAGDDSQRLALVNTLKDVLETRPGARKPLAGDFRSADGMVEWRRSIHEWRGKIAPHPNEQPKLFIKEAWDRWLTHVTTYLRLPSAFVPPTPHFEDMAIHAAGFLPSTLLRPDLQNLSLLDWSRLALHGAMSACGQDSAAPLWALPAGLLALRIDRDAIFRACGNPIGKPAIATPEHAIDRLLADAPPAEKAVLYIIQNRTLPPDATVSIIPGLYIDESDIDDLAPALSWLQDNGLFDEVIYER